MQSNTVRNTYIHTYIPCQLELMRYYRLSHASVSLLPKCFILMAMHVVCVCAYVRSHV